MQRKSINQHVPLTHDGFELAWDLLTSRYENKRILMNEQLLTLLHLPQATADSNSLQKIQRTMNSCIRTLKSLDIEASNWDPNLVLLCKIKPILTSFESSLDDCTESPRWSDLDKFLTNKIKTLESVSSMTDFNKNQSDVSKPQKRLSSLQTNISKGQNNNSNLSSPTCQFCKAGHYLSNCSNFLQKPINDFT